MHRLKLNSAKNCTMCIHSCYTFFFKAKFGNKKWKIHIQLLRYYFFCRPNLKIYSNFYKRRICESSVQTTGCLKGTFGKAMRKDFRFKCCFQNSLQILTCCFQSYLRICTCVSPNVLLHLYILFLIFPFICTFVSQMFFLCVHCVSKLSCKLYIVHWTVVSPNVPFPFLHCSLPNSLWNLYLLGWRFVLRYL